MPGDTSAEALVWGQHGCHRQGRGELQSGICFGPKGGKEEEFAGSFGVCFSKSVKDVVSPNLPKTMRMTPSVTQV